MRRKDYTLTDDNHIDEFDYDIDGTDEFMRQYHEDKEAAIKACRTLTADERRELFNVCTKYSLKIPMGNRLEAALTEAAAHVARTHNRLAEEGEDVGPLVDTSLFPKAENAED